VVDNIMTLSVDRQDNTAQSEVADLFRMFVAKFPVHLHLVAHPRKPPQIANYIPHIADIRGASEWGDQAANVIVVWRDTEKAERIAEMENDGYPRDEIQEYWKTQPCGKIICRKQREGGDLPMLKVWFHKETKRFTKTPELPIPMYKIAPWEMEPEEQHK
jgi:twinkle protein